MDALVVEIVEHTIAITTSTRASTVETIAESVGLLPNGAITNIDQLARDNPVST